MKRSKKLSPFERLSRSIDEARAFMAGDESKGRLTMVDVEVPDVKAIRKKTGLSQAEFAAKTGINK